MNSNNVNIVISNAKSEMNKAVSKFESSSRSVELMASSSIDLYSPTALSEFRHILVTARDACDNLYTTCQSLVISLDNVCRPILTGVHDVRLIREVYMLIKELNENSEIEHNVGTSVGDIDLGNYSATYHPSVETKSVEKYWEFTYKTAPEYEEFEKEIKEEKERQAEIEIKKREVELKKPTQQEYWDMIMKEYDKALDKKEAQIRENIENKKIVIEKEYIEIIHSASNKKEKAKNALQEKQAELNSVGLFAFSKKKELKGIIEKMMLEVKELEDKIATMESEMKAKIIKCKSASSYRYDYELWKDVCNKNPKPESFRKAITTNKNMNHTQIENLALCADICDLMLTGQWYTSSDIVEMLNDDRVLSTQKATSLLKTLCDEGKVQMMKNYEKETLYSLA